MITGLKARLKRGYDRWRGIRGNVDTLIGDRLHGWAISSDPARTPLRVGLFDGDDRLLSEAIANIHRPDVEAAGIGDGRCGFELPVTPATMEAAIGNGGRVAVRVLGRKALLIGHYQLAAPGGAAQPGSRPPALPQDALARRLYSDLLSLRAGLKQIHACPPDETPPPLERQKLLFAGTDYINGGTLPAPMCASLDYIRYRNRYDESFDISDPEEARHFTKFFVDFFGPARNGLRIPLPKAALDHFNTPVPVDGHRFELTRATWAWLVDYPVLRNTMDLENPDWCFAACYWWSIHQCGSMHVEDCLVPDHYIAVLSAIQPHWQERSFPLTRFMEQYTRESPELSALDVEQETARETITAALMIRALQRPDFLRYLPPASVAALLAQDRDACALSRFATRMMAGPETMPAFGAGEYRRALRLAGFDLGSGRFLSLTPEGDRLEAAMLPVPQGEKVDIQMIGPFQKASGLGQATRLSQAILAQTPYSVNAVDFGLDNPAPEGFSRVGTLADIRPAKVNLIHLNAESIPLVYAYKPDVFTGAWNIGYFYWELDSPAACHYLGMDLLDEIWVSTDYGVSIYRPHTDRPVTNVGMCFEELPEVDAGTARAFVAEKCAIRPGEFVFLVAFDSFSFVQRKNPVGTIRAFLQAFADDRDVRLIVKTQNRRKIADPVQIAVWAEIDALVADDPRITILDETLTYDDLLLLKKGSDAYVSLHRSEGWGFGMIEAMNLRVPVVATGYSGNMEFCSDETAFLVDYREVELKHGDYIFIRPGQKWAEPDLDDAARQMRLVRQDAALRARRVEAAWQNVRTRFSTRAIARRYEARLREIMAARVEA